jgi:hypothetical protein
MQSVYYINKTNSVYVRFEILTVVVMEAAMFWDIVPCSLYTNQRFGYKYHLNFQAENQPSKKSEC